MESLNIYGRKGCSRCKIVVDILKRVGRVYNYIDVNDLSSEQNEELSILAVTKGVNQLPIIVWNDNVIVDVKEIL